MLAGSSGTGNWPLHYQYCCTASCTSLLPAATAVPSVLSAATAVGTAVCVLVNVNVAYCTAQPQ